MLGAIVLGIAALAAGPEATATPPVNQQQAKPIVVEGNRRVCHEITSTGSILPKRICKTVDQWEQERVASQRFIDQRAREQTTYWQTVLNAKRARGEN